MDNMGKLYTTVSVVFKNATNFQRFESPTISVRTLLIFAGLFFFVPTILMGQSDPKASRPVKDEAELKYFLEDMALPSTLPYEWLKQEGKDARMLSEEATMDSNEKSGGSDVQGAPPPDCDVVVFAGADVTICNGDAAVLVAIGLQGTFPYTYEWSTGEFGNIQIVYPTETTEYSVTITDADGCTDVDQVTVRVNDGIIQERCILIDDFTTGTGTETNIEVTDEDPGPVIFNDGNATNAIGGYRQTILNHIYGEAFIIIPYDDPEFTHSNNFSSISTSQLCYNGNGSGINLDLTGMEYLSFRNFGVDHSGVDVVITLSDGTNDATYSSHLSGLGAGFRYDQFFFYDDFINIGNVDITSIQSLCFDFSFTDEAVDFGFTMINTCGYEDCVVSAGDDVTICEGDETQLHGSIDCEGDNYTYAWDNGAANVPNPLVSPTETTQYTLTVTDQNGCSEIDKVTVYVDPKPTILGSTADQTICLNESVMLSIAAQGDVRYDWSTGEMGPVITVSPTTTSTYSVTVTDNNTGCDTEEDFVVTVNPLPSLATSKANATCGDNNGTATATGSGTTEPYTYAWSNGGNTATITGLAPGTYTVTVTDGNGCTKSKNVSIINIPGPEIQINTAGEPEICFGSDIELTVNIDGGTAPFTYEWDNGSTASSITVSPNATKQYSVIVTDANGCTDQDNIQVVVNPAVNITIVSVVDEICGNEEGMITSLASQGTPPYTYTWSTGHVGPMLENVGAGTYNVTVVDSKGCSASTSATVGNEIQTPDLSVTASPSEICVGSSSTLTASASGTTGPYTYAWSDGLGSGATKTVSPSSTKTYHVTVTDHNGCTNTGSVTVTVNPKPNFNFTKTNATCGEDNGTAMANPYVGEAPFSYNWNTGATTQTITGLAAGTYTVTVTDANGCSRSKSVNISNVAGPGLAIDAHPEEICEGYSSTLTASTSGGTAPFTFEWDNNLGSGHTKVVSPGSTTTYSVTVTDANGCSEEGSITLTVHPNPSVTISCDADTGDGCVLCQGDNTTLTANPSGGTGPYTYDWSNGHDSQAINVSPNGTTDYTVTITDVNGCTDHETITVIVNPTPHVSIAKNNATCGLDNGSVTASADGGTTPYTYTWSDGLGNGASKNNLPTGTYTVTVTDANGCTDTENVTIINIPGPGLDAHASPAEICEGESTDLTAVVNGGTAPFTYDWSNGLGSGPNKTVSPNTTTTYSVTVTDGNDCTETATVTVIVNYPPIVSTSSTDATCGGANGSASVVASGGEAPYSYLWSNGGTTATISGYCRRDLQCNGYRC
jgi:hypothetical protein